ncbi:hypothetical protein EBR66_07415, partial [bacterium]|nr:hypothetical protein [bacterium]
MGNYMSSWGSTGAGVVGKVKGADYRGAADKAKDMAREMKQGAGSAWDSAKKAVKRRTSKFQDYGDEEDEEDYEEDFQDYEDEDEDEEEEFANYLNEPKWMQRIQNSTIC